MEGNIQLIILSDGKPGHDSASKGVLKSMEMLAEVDVVFIHTKLRVKQLRPFLKCMLNSGMLDKLPKWSQIYLLKMAYQFSESFGLSLKNSGHWLVSTGGDTSFVNAWLSSLYGLNNIYCSSLRGLHASHFKVIISTAAMQGVENNIKVNLAPAPINTREIMHLGKQFRSNFGLESATVWCVLIGGEGAGYKYTDSDFIFLARHLIQLSEKYSAKLVLTTSRRTGIHAERLIRSVLTDYAAVVHATYFNESPEPVMAKYLGACDVVFCTIDSGSMLTEAISAGKPAYALVPSSARETRSYQQFLDGHITAGRLKITSLDELSALDPKTDIATYFHPIDEDPVSDLATKLASWVIPDAIRCE